MPYPDYKCVLVASIHLITTLRRFPSLFPVHLRWLNFRKGLLVFDSLDREGLFVVNLFDWFVLSLVKQLAKNIKTNWAKQTNFTLRWSSLWKTERLFRSLCRWNPPFPSLIRDVIRCQDTCDESASARMIDAINITTWLDKRQKVQRKSDETRPSKSWRAQNNLTNLELNRLIQEIENAKVLGEGSRFKFFASLYGL